MTVSVEKRVLIVKGKPWGSVTTDELGNLADHLKGLLEISSEAMFDVQIVDNADDARQRIKEGSMGSWAIIFLSRSMIAEAERLAADLNSPSDEEIRVILLSGLIPKNKVILLPKEAITRSLIVKLVEC